MKYKPSIIALLFFCVFFNSQCGQEGDSKSHELRDPYLDQKLPVMTAEVFAPDLLSKIEPEWIFCSVFSPDGNELYFTTEQPNDESSHIMQMKRVDGVWTKSEKPHSAAYLSKN